jgi:eukaryotic-like serine/threonine-protein kinase
MATDDSTTNFVPSGFRLVERLGVGTVFAIARVVDAQGRELICKRAAHPRFASALERERDVLTILCGAAVPELVTSGLDTRGGFLVETRARGAPLRELMSEGQAPPTASTWIALAKASAHALATLHALRDGKGRLGFVHGDISPDNLFFEPPATVTLIDFSSASYRDRPDPPHLDDRGTAPYAAPELLRQETRATPECDTYALAATLLAAAVGLPIVHATTEAARLYEAASQGVLWARIDERADLPSDLRSTLVEALQYERARRLVSSGELAARLGPLSSPDPHRHE